MLGLYIIMFFTLIGDNATANWYPFAKNMSSTESIFFVDDSVIISPLEVFLVVTTIAWLLNYQDRVGRPRRAQFRRGTLLYPLMGFTFFVLYGYLQGMRTGGDRNVALWEMRPLLYVPVFYVLVTQLLTTRQQYVRLFMVAMVAVFVHAVFAINYFRGLPAVERAELESLGEHGASIHIDALLLLVLALMLIKGCSPRLRVGMFLLAVPCLVAYADGRAPGRGGRAGRRDRDALDRAPPTEPACVLVVRADRHGGRHAVPRRVLERPRFARIRGPGDQVGHRSRSAERG